MLDELHDGDLSLDLLQNGLSQFVLVDDLDRHLLVQDAVGAELNQTWKRIEKKRVLIFHTLASSLCIFEKKDTSAFLLELVSIQPLDPP